MLFTESQIAEIKNQAAQQATQELIEIFKRQIVSQALVDKFEESEIRSKEWKKERQRQGIEKAKLAGVYKKERRKKAPYIDLYEAVKLGKSYRKVAKEFGVGSSTVDRAVRHCKEIEANLKAENFKLRSESIKEGLRESEYVPKGKSPNLEKHNEIIRLLNETSYTKDEIAKMVNCGIATVYRVCNLHPNQITR